MNSLGSGSFIGAAPAAIATAVAAAASVPFSSTATKALCTTAEMKSSLVPSMPEKSARFASKACGMPIADSVSASENDDVVLKRGSDTITFVRDGALVHACSFASSRLASSLARPSCAFGSTTIIDVFSDAYGSSSTFASPTSA